MDRMTLPVFILGGLDRRKACKYLHNLVHVCFLALSNSKFKPEIYNGIFPCFFGGFFSRFPSSISSASISRRRVSCGSITAST